MKINDAPANVPPAVTAKNAGQENSEALKVAKEFESLFAAYMVRSMRSAVMRSELIPESTGEKMYTEMLDGEYANLIANNKSLGLADMILKEIEQNESETSVLDALRGLGRQPWTKDARFIPSNTGMTAQSMNEKVSVWTEIIEDAAKKFNVDPNLISAVIAQESAGDPNAVSKAGAKGLMQLIDTTATDMGVESVFNPRQNIFGGTKYLKNLLERHNGNEQLALASYNAGPGAVDRYAGIPPYPETQNYVENVLKLRSLFANKSSKENVQ